MSSKVVGLYSLCFYCFCLFAAANSHDISFGALVRDTEEDDLGSAVRTATLVKGGNDDTITLANQSAWASSRIMGAAKTDLFKFGKTACMLINSGRKILLASGDSRTYNLLKALREEFNLVYINWALPPSSVVPPLSRFEVSIYPPVYYAAADFVAWKRWDRLIYVYETEQGIWNQRSLISYLKSKKNRSMTIESIQLPTWKSNSTAPDYFRFFLDFHARYYVGDHYVILDVENVDTLKRLLVDLQDAAMKTRNFHYLIASYGVSKAEFDPFRNGLMNITIIQLLDDDSPRFQHVQSVWRDLHASYYRRPSQQNRLSPRAAMAYDSVLVAAAGILKTERQDRYRYDWNKQRYQSKQKQKQTHSNSDYCQMDDDNELPSAATQRQQQGESNSNTSHFNTPEFAELLATSIRNVHTSGLTGNIEFDENGFRKNYDLKFHGLEFHNLGDGPIGVISNKTWRQGVGFLDHVQSEGFAAGEKSINLANTTLIITTVLVDPFVIKTRDYEKNKDKDDNKDKFEGYCIDLVKLISERMDNFDYIIRLSADGKYGVPNNGGDWDGMVGELISGKAHMAIAPVTINRARERVIDFSKPFLTTGISIMIKKPDKQEFSVFSFMQPLSREVWMYIIFAYVGVSVVIFLISRFSPYEWRVEEGAHGIYTISNDFSIYNCLWFTLAAFMQQGTDILPRSVSGRIASSAWWFFTMIIVSSYTANLAAFLTMEKMRAPIESVEDLVKQSKIKYGIQRGGSTAAFFRESTVQVHSRMWQYMESHKDEVMVATYAEGIQKVRDSKGGYAFLLEATANEYANTRKPCDTMKVGSNLNSVGYGVATPFRSPLTHRVNLAILELQEKGELKRLENKWWYEKGQCEQGMTDSQSASLTLSKVAGIFYILLGGMVVAMGAAFGEFFHRSRKQARKNREGSVAVAGRLGSAAQLTNQSEDKK